MTSNTAKAVTQSEMAELLKKSGWREIPNVRHAWRWRKAPLPAQYTLADAFSLEMARKTSRAERERLVQVG